MPTLALHTPKLFAGAVLFILAAPGWAAGEGKPKPLIEEIVVTADRQDSSRSKYIQAGTFRGASQLETPLTVTVLTDEILRSQQAENVGEALRNSAGVTGNLVSPAVYSNPSIRGIPVDGRNNVKLNGSLSVVNFIDLPLDNKARVEVLKGVSALYYGFATPAGIINLVTRRPPASPEFNISTSANSYGQVQARIDGGATFGALGFRGTVAGGPVDVGIRQTRGKRNFQAIAISLEPSEELRFDVDMERIAKDVTEPTILRGTTSRQLLLTELPRLPNPRSNAGSIGFRNRARELNLLARMRWTVAHRWVITADGGVSNASRDRRFSTLSLFDSATGLGTLTLLAADDQLFRNRSFRADLTGSVTTGSFTHELLIGASHHRRRQYFTPPRLAAGRTSPSGCVLLGLDSRCQQNAFDPIELRDVTFDGDMPYDSTRDTKASEAGLYAFDRIRWGGVSGDALNLIVGLRQASYREFVARDRDDWRLTFDSKPLTLSAAVVYRPSRATSLYASFIEGIESAPPAPNLTVNQGEILPPGKSKQIEIGFKAEAPPGLLVNAAYFDIDRRLLYVNSAGRFVGDGTGYYRGIEAGVSGTLTRDLSVIASAILLDARQNVPGDPVIDGKRIENSARRQWSAFAEYRLRTLIPGAAVNIGAFYTGRRAINPENSLLVDGYTIVDAGASYEMKIGKIPMTARITASNLFGKRYVASTGSNLLAMGLPTVIRFTLEARIF